MKIAVIIFHKNIKSYPEQWIKKCVESIQSQTYKEFDVFEIDYGGTETQIYPNSIFESSGSFNNHAQAHNYLLDKVFACGYDYAFNVNVDDFYSPDRFEKQLKYAEMGFDIISSNFYNIDENDAMMKQMTLHHLSIINEAATEHNIIAHPCVCYSRKFWTTCTRLNGDEIPKDDFELWKRSFGKYTFIILPDYLLYYRVHQQKVSNPRINE